MGRLLQSAQAGTYQENERRHTRVNYYLSATMVAGSVLLGYGLDIGLGIVSMPGVAIILTCVALLVTRND
jgi:hypothetical protein